MSQLNEWNKLSPVGKEMMKKLYGSKEGFLSRNGIRDLEPYVKHVDQSMGDKESLMKIAIRLGIDLDMSGNPIDTSVLMMEEMMNLMDRYEDVKHKIHVENKKVPVPSSYYRRSNKEKSTESNWF